MSVVIAQDFLRETTGYFFTFERANISNGDMETIWKQCRTLKL